MKPALEKIPLLTPESYYDSGVKSKLNFFLPPSLQPSVEPNGRRMEVAQGIGHQQCFF